MKSLVLFAFVVLSACSSGGVILPAPKTPSEAVLESGTAINAALLVANAYGDLPTCPVSAPICKTAAVLATVQKSARAADAAQTSAEDLVISPTFKNGTGAQQAIAAAQAASQALTVIIATLPKK